MPKLGEPERKGASEPREERQCPTRGPETRQTLLHAWPAERPVRNRARRARPGRYSLPYSPQPAKASVHLRIRTATHGPYLTVR